MCRGYNNICFCERVLLRTEPRTWSMGGSAVRHTKPHTNRVRNDTQGIQLSWPYEHEAPRLLYMHAQSTPIAVLPRRRCATEAIGKWFISNSLPQLPARTRWYFVALNCAVMLSCVCNLPAHPCRFEATSQDEKHEINLLQPFMCT